MKILKKYFFVKYDLAIAILLAFSIICFQNCGKNFQAMRVTGQADSLSVEDLDPVCMDGSSDACLYLKSIVAQTRMPAGALTADQMGAAQQLPVSLKDITTDSLLKNQSFIVFEKGSSSPLAADANGKWRYSYSSPQGPSKLEQLMSFYWANFAASNAFLRTGAFYAQDKQIKIITGDSYFGWAPAKNQIHLIGTDAKKMALDASLVVYFLGLANLDYATGGKINSFSKPNLHVTCGAQQKMDCCSTKNGCSRAIASGQADYFVAMTFPKLSAVADGWSDKIAGHSICNSSLARDPAALPQEITSEQVFSLCSTQSQAGDIHAMGALYSAIWWDVRQSAEEAKSAEVDSLFMMHLKVLDGDDDFISVQSKILAIDRASFAGRYRTAFESAFRRRGLLDPLP